MTWYIVGAMAAIAAGWVAGMINLSGYAPLGILPVGVGIALGAILTGVATFTGVTCRRRLIIGAAMLAIVAVLAEHAWLYGDFRRQWHAARVNSPQIALFRPEAPWSPAEYFAHEASPGRVVLWCLDAALVTAATVGTVAAARRWFK